MRIEDIQGLSPRALRLLRRNPSEAGRIVAAALDAAAQVYDWNTGPSDVPPALQPFIVPATPEPELIGVSEAADRLDVSRTTVYDWVRTGRLLGWRGTKRGLRIPAEQIRGPGEVVHDLPAVLALIGDPALAWAFLSQPWPFEDDVARPLDKLAAGETATVLDAAPAFGTAMT
ncbi:helix-turn-helix domain-containing protein [Roseospira goensis]|uniref:Excisionase family DNA binding protein n=1 Tax=Roseospira goensis TaxID=391922 RepID=A0A7W6WME2_9PROT|nr:helix-turn-helix domain-containing protein [Roseospira goensis]MBB4287849.1 excisionase family DNA binding protein [Roseospira goensis]